MPSTHESTQHEQSLSQEHADSNDISQSLTGRFRLGSIGAVILLVYGFSLYLPNLGNTRVLTYHEVVFAEPAKEILATGDWAVPRIAGVPFNDKPPGTAWSIALSMLLTGSQSEFAVRLPSAIAVVLGGLMIGLAASRFFGSTIGLVAGLLHLTAYSSVQLGRLAECDVFLTTSVIGAISMFATANIESPRGRWKSAFAPLLFYAFVTAAFFYKGLIGGVFIFSSCLLHTLATRQWRCLAFLINPLGILLFVITAGTWFYFALLKHPLLLQEMVLHQFGRFRGEIVGGVQPWYFYSYALLLDLLPWSGALVMAIFLSASRKKISRSLAVLGISWLVPGLVLLSASAFKAKHYCVPLLPPLTILSAVLLVDFIRLLQSKRGVRQWAGGIASIIGGAVAIWAIQRAAPKGEAAIIAMAAIISLGLVLMAVFEYRGKFRGELATLFSMVWLVTIGALNFVLPLHDSYKDQVRLARRIAGINADGEPVVLLGLPENQIIYYLDSPLVRIDDPRERHWFSGSDRSTYLVLAPEYIALGLSRYGNLEVLDRCDSINRYLKEWERLTLVRFSTPLEVAREKDGHVQVH